MSNIVLVGAQWGDEGKGKVIDYLTDKVDVVVRSQGGNNAGHTVVVGEKKYILRLLPSGILRRGKLCVIGNGVVLDPIALWKKKISELAAHGVKINSKNLLISECAHLVFPFIRRSMSNGKSPRGRQKIGTTKRGIGPAYGDKIARIGIRLGELLQPKCSRRNCVRGSRMSTLSSETSVKSRSDVRRCWISIWKLVKKIRPLVTNTVLTIHKAMAAGQEILFEGAQGTFLDVDHGTYPYVTSSNTTAGGACTGSGVPPNRIDRVVGAMKAYTTRVGEGPFPPQDASLPT